MATDLKRRLETFPRTPLGAFPTPFHPAPRFSASIGKQTWLKRDDLSGFAFGGNKVRKIEFLVADAVRSGADTLVTVGGGQSNHARCVAAAAAMHGMECHLMLGGARPQIPSGNVLLGALFGAHLHFGNSDDWDVLEKKMDGLVADLVARGRKPYAMPVGGSTSIGALGFARAYLELLEDCLRSDVRPRTIVHATSTGGTQAGLEAARCILGREAPRVVGISVAKTATDLSQEVSELVDDLIDLLGGAEISPQVEVMSGFMGRSYGIPTPGANAALELLAQTEGVPTDPIYSAKALHAVVDPTSDLEEPIIFWHTGGLPALFTEDQGFMDWNGFSQRREV